MKVFEKVSKYINDNGIKQRYVSEKTGIPENILSAILNGKRKMEADEFINIVIAIGVEPNYFINSQEKEVKE